MFTPCMLTSARYRVQLDFFPEKVSVRALDRHDIAGARTRVTQIFVVQFERERQPHQVFCDQHGWYCAEHGPHCRAVPEVTARYAPPDA